MPTSGVCGRRLLKKNKNIVQLLCIWTSQGWTDWTYTVSSSALTRCHVTSAMLFLERVTLFLCTDMMIFLMI